MVRVMDKPRVALESKHRAFANPYGAPNPALFGDGPENTYWEMVHGHGGDAFEVSDWMTRTGKSVSELWEVSAHD